MMGPAMSGVQYARRMMNESALIVGRLDRTGKSATRTSRKICAAVSRPSHVASWGLPNTGGTEFDLIPLSEIDDDGTVAAFGHFPDVDAGAALLHAAWAEPGQDCPTLASASPDYATAFLALT